MVLKVKMIKKCSLAQTLVACPSLTGGCPPGLVRAGVADVCHAGAASAVSPLQPGVARPPPGQGARVVSEHPPAERYHRHDHRHARTRYCHAHSEAGEGHREADECPEHGG